ncbi:RNA polymerase sigma-70 factor [Pedobacter petrophilus]|uniref:RNA polymerase sigma-70 factor n=1 Tax=Pedobacter petrophilus TaxID=1908241 RepID=A0A7K0FW33_9SPHI|nr:RNA polymerase sigma-70 factor [Pedobacter petrophilus]MRX75735.1 RNA polymerase sigma-70 factor [Pedobacter petrophilus]
MQKHLQIWSDDDLIVLLHDDDTVAFKLIYEKYAPKLFHTVYNLVRNKEASEDVIQDLFSDLWQKRAKLNITTSLQGFLYTAAKNRILAQLRKRKITIDADALAFLADSNHTDNRLLEMELKQKLNQEINLLPRKCAEIFQLSRESQYSHQEIAKHLNISVKTVENQVGIALKRLKANLTDFLILLVLFLPGL